MNQIPKESIRLLRDVDAYMVPSGDEVKLLAGNLVKITQALGGNYTVIMNGNMVQIREENVRSRGFDEVGSCRLILRKEGLSGHLSSLNIIRKSLIGKRFESNFADS